MTLPFVSYGGTSLAISMAMIGVLVNIASNNGRSKRAKSKRPRKQKRPRVARPSLAKNGS